MKTPDQISEELGQRFVSEMDRETLRHNISLRDAARIAREIASEFRDRASGLESEADAEDKLS